MNAKQEAGLSALLTSKTLEEAAEKADVTSRTLRRWLQEPDFSTAYNEARRRLVESAIVQLQSVTGDAVAALKRNLNAKSEAVQVSSARTILDFAVASVATLDLEQRINELERAVESLTPKGRK